MQLFLIGFIIIEICEILSVGGFPLDGKVRRAFSAIHIAAIVATLWILMMNGAVGYQLIDDGTALSLALIFGSAAALFVGTGYIALDTGFSWTGYWNDTLVAPNRSYSLYTLYQLVPLVFLVVFFILEAVLVLRVLGELRPMCKLPAQSERDHWPLLMKLTVYLLGAAIAFALGQIFQYVSPSTVKLDNWLADNNKVISRYICNGTNGAINGGLFETLFTLASVILIWLFWDSITEDDFVFETSGTSVYT